MTLVEKQSEGLIFYNPFGLAAYSILTDDDANKVFCETDGNIAGVEWDVEIPEAELPEAEVHITHIHNNQYVAVEDHDKNDEYEHSNNNKGTKVDNDNEITGVANGNESTEVENYGKSTGAKLESESMGVTEANNEANYMALIDDAIE